VRAFETEGDQERRRTAVAYGVNTIGAVAGVCLATFFLIEFLGEVKTLLFAACLSGLVGLLARGLARRETEMAGATEESDELTEVSLAGTPASLVLIAAAATGFVFFFMEIVWYRMLGPILGGTTFTFGIILAVALFGIALGGWLYALVATGGTATPEAFAATCALEGVALAVPLALGDRIALLAALSSDFAALGFGGALFSWVLIASIVVLPAALVAGFQFPLLVALLGEGRARVGRQVGMAYACNTFGSIAGALLGGFVLLTSMGAVACWRFAVVTCLGLSLLALAVALFHPRRKDRRPSMASLAAPVVAVAIGGFLLTALGPTAVWRHGGIGAGRASLNGDDRNTIKRFVHSKRRNVIWEADGRESSVGLEAANSYAFVLNGKVDGNAVNDGGTQVMSGLLGALLHGNPGTAMVVGLGTGSTAGWLAEVPSIERVDVLELEPAIEYVAEVCTPVNRDVLHHPKVQITYGDAREALLTSRQRYDLVVSEPSNPYRAGIASLFTADFYVHVRNRLNEGGLFLQWFQGYEVDSRTVAVVLKTLDAVFPEVEVWRTLKHDLLLVASVEPIEIDLEQLRRRVASEPYVTAMRSTWHSRSAEGVLARFIAGPGLAASLRESPTVPVNTDDRNLLEFMLAKSVGRHGLFEVETLREGARGLGADRPRIASGSPQPDWSLVERERIGAFYEEPPESSSELTPLLRFHRQWRRGDGAAALETWTSAELYPVTDVEQIGLAAAAGFMGDEAAEDILATLEGPYATESSIVRGRMLLEQGDTDGALSNFSTAVERLREDPWAHPGIFTMLFESLDRVATEDPSVAPAVFDLLGPSFAVERARDERLWLRFRVASLIGAREFAAVLDEVEPWVPWDPWMLQQRAKVRGQMRDPRAQDALSDVGDFARNAPVPFTSIGGRRVPASEAPPRPPSEER
jgi:spermidine synthase